MTTTRQERRKQQTRQKLLDAARRLIAAQGYETTGVVDITDAADVSKGTFYLYFKDKEELTRALILEGFEELRAGIQRVLTGESGLPRVSESLRVAFRFAAEKRDLFRIMLGSQASTELSELAFAYFVEALEEIFVLPGVSDKVKALPAALLAHFIAGAIVRLAIWWLEDDHGLSSEAMGEIAYHLLREGVFKRGYGGLVPATE